MNIQTRILMAMGLLSSWLGKAMSDGKIDTNELLDLLTSVVSAFGLGGAIEIKLK